MKILSVIAVSLLSSAVIAQGNSTSVKNVDVKSFSSIKASGVFTLKLAQGPEGVKMEGDQELISRIQVVNEGNTLVIKMDDKKEKINSKKGATVTVSFKDLSSAEFNMVGDVKSAGTLKFSNLVINNNMVGDFSLDLSATSLVMKNKGVGEVELKGSATKAEITNSGVGEVDADDFKVQEMQVSNSGVGSVTVNVEKSIKVRNSGLGSVKNVGAAKMPSNRTVDI